MQMAMLWNTISHGLVFVCFNRHDRRNKKMEKTCIICSKWSHHDKNPEVNQSSSFCCITCPGYLWYIICLLWLQAGIASVEYPDQLLIALEPEAASIYVRRLRMHQLVPEYAEQRPLLSPTKHPIEPLSPMNMDAAVDNIRAGLLKHFSLKLYS